MTKPAAFFAFADFGKRFGTPIVQHNMVTGSAGVNEFLGCLPFLLLQDHRGRGECSGVRIDTAACVCATGLLPPPWCPRSEPYQCNCTQPMFKCRCHETEPKCGWWVHFGCTQYWQCDECPGERVCTMCTRETVTKVCCDFGPYHRAPRRNLQQQQQQDTTVISAVETTEGH